LGSAHNKKRLAFIAASIFKPNKVKTGWPLVCDGKLKGGLPATALRSNTLTQRLLHTLDIHLCEYAGILGTLSYYFNVKRCRLSMAKQIY
jgi:hypothetical protein